MKTGQLQSCGIPKEADENGTSAPTPSPTPRGNTWPRPESMPERRSRSSTTSTPSSCRTWPRSRSRGSPSGGSRNGIARSPRRQRDSAPASAARSYIALSTPKTKKPFASARVTPICSKPFTILHALQRNGRKPPLLEKCHEPCHKTRIARFPDRRRHLPGLVPELRSLAYPRLRWGRAAMLDAPRRALHLGRFVPPRLLPQARAAKHNG